MRVLHVISTLASRYGGPVTVVRGLARDQVRSNHDVTVCTTNCDYPRGLLRVPRNVEYVDEGVRIWHFETQFRPLLVSGAMAAWLKANIHRFDIVHVHELYRFPPTFAARLCRQRGVPYVVQVHGSLDPYIYRQSHHNLLAKRIYERWFDLPNLHGAAAILFTAEEEMRAASFLGLRAPGVIVPNGIDTEWLAELPAFGRFRKRIGVAEKVPLVLFVGRLNFVKGLDLLIPAFGLVAKEIPEVRLAIVGPDNEGLGRDVREWCRQQGVLDRVVFTDHLEPDEVREAYVDADVFVLPSYSENFGMTVLEAMGCGCPVIISRQVKIAGEVQRADAGLVVPLHVPAIAQAVTAILRERETGLAMGAAGRELAKARYTWSAVTDKMTALYETLVVGCVTVNPGAGNSDDVQV